MGESKQDVIVKGAGVQEARLERRRVQSLKTENGDTYSAEHFVIATGGWTGVRACTPDGVPAIGKLSGLDNAWVGSGHWHFGLALAPPTAVMLAELITTDRSTVDSKLFDPARY